MPLGTLRTCGNQNRTLSTVQFLIRLVHRGEHMQHFTEKATIDAMKAPHAAHNQSGESSPSTEVQCEGSVVRVWW